MHTIKINSPGDDDEEDEEDEEEVTLHDVIDVGTVEQEGFYVEQERRLAGWD